jgi:hypothetical protein
MMTIFTLTTGVVVGWFVLNRLLVTFAPPEPEMPKGGIRRIGRPCGFDR